MLGLLWAQMEHHVCTGFGVSEKTYGSTTEKLLYEIGQGSCASPILWALINQPLVAALGEKLTFIDLVAIDGEEEHIRPGDSFVDDTTTGTTKDDSELESVSHVISDLTSSEETLIAKMEEIIQFFLDLLQVTGGDLAPEKCVWYLISHRWKDGKPKLLQKHSSHIGIKIVSRSTNTESGVNRKAPTEGHSTLGFLMTGDGTCTAHKKVMKEKASLYATAVTRSSVWKGEITRKQHRTMVNKWQTPLSEIRSTVLAIPGGKGMSSVLQDSLRFKCDQGTRAQLSNAVHLVLADTRRPTRIAEIILKEQPDTLGAQYDAAMDMGGVHFVPQLDGSVYPIL
jgi:hypothetical protein